MGTVFAIHGDFGANRLRRDMGDPDFVDYYLNWSRKDKRSNFNELKNIISSPKFETPFVFIGYSYGGEVINQLMNRYFIRKNTVGIIQYESPLFSVPPTKLMKHIGVMQIWNNYTPRSRVRARNKQVSKYFWLNRSGLSVFKITGYTKGHVKFYKTPPFIGHGWDTSINPIIKTWLKTHCIENKS